MHEEHATHPIRILFAHSDEWFAKLDAWRAAQPGLPSRSSAVRYLVMLGIKATESKSKRKPRR